MAARTVGLVQQADGMDAKSAAMARNGSMQSLTAEKNWRTSETARIGRRPTALWTQSLPSAARFRLMKVPCRFIPTGDARPTRQARARISAQFLFPPQMRHAVCPPTGIWTATQPLKYIRATVQLDVERTTRDPWTRRIDIVWPRAAYRPTGCCKCSTRRISICCVLACLLETRQ